MPTAYYLLLIDVEHEKACSSFLGDGTREAHGPCWLTACWTSPISSPALTAPDLTDERSSEQRPIFIQVSDKFSVSFTTFCTLWMVKFI